MNGFSSSYIISNPEGWKMLIQDMFKPPDFIYLNVSIEAFLPKTPSMKSSIYLVAGTMLGILSVVSNYGDPQDQWLIFIPVSALHKVSGSHRERTLCCKGFWSHLDLWNLMVWWLLLLLKVLFSYWINFLITCLKDIGKWVLRNIHISVSSTTYSYPYGFLYICVHVWLSTEVC